MLKLVIALMLIVNVNIAAASEDTKESSAQSTLCGMYGYGCSGSRYKDLAEEMKSEVNAEAELEQAPVQSELK